MPRLAPFCVVLALLAGCRQAPRPRPRDDAGAAPQSTREELHQRAAKLSDAELAHCVELLFQDADPERENFRLVLYAGSRAIPFLVKALDDPRTAKTIFSTDPLAASGPSPFWRICDLLEDSPAPEAIPHLVPYLQHPSRQFRQQAALVLALIGSPDCVAPVKKALADGERGVREWALIGLMRGLSYNRRDPAFLSALFDALKPLLKEPGYVVESPAGALAAIDFARAVPILESPECFTTSNPQLHEVLKSLDRKGHKVPHAQLLPLLHELATLAPTESRREIEYAAALLLYANHPDAAAESRFRSLLFAPAESVAEAAGSGLETLAGIDPQPAVWAVYDRGGLAAMSQPQKYYFAVKEYYYEVFNGGHRQYFYNSAADHYPLALEALRLMGLKAKARILESSLGAFLPERPSTVWSVRRSQMEALSDTQEQFFNAANDHYSESDKNPAERISARLTLYALTHRDEFRPPSGHPFGGAARPAPPSN